MLRLFFILLAFCGTCVLCGRQGTFTGAADEVKLMTVDPGHFHAALVQKIMYPQVSPVVHVYAPDGPDVQEHLKWIDNYNNRSQDPTRWQEIVYTGPDYMRKMLREKPGNVMVIAGNNQKKIEYIKAAVNAGIHVLSDKPMCIDKSGFEVLKAAFDTAQKKHVLLYDIMTERYEIASVLQKEIVNRPRIFGDLQAGSPEEPSVTKESVHHLFKYVSGIPLKRPDWFFDTTQQGDGIVDVTTHLVDLVMWECFPEQIINYTGDIRMLHARHWPTLVNQEQFQRVTSLTDFPDFLKNKLNADGVLPVYCNGEMVFSIRGIHAKVSVTWNYEAPPGGGDTHFSIMKGSRAYAIIRQGKEQNYLPTLYIEPAPGVDTDALATDLAAEFNDLQKKYPGIELGVEHTGWIVRIPQKYRVGHEAHFSQVTEIYLNYLIDGQLPVWEVPNMLAKYYTTTSALEMAKGVENMATTDGDR
jgi:predicted dehydrogenase